MKRHRFDAVSFFFGLVFTALSAWVLFADDLDIFDVRWVWPSLLIVGGVALIASMFGRGGDSAEPSPQDEPMDPMLEAAAEELPANPFGS